MSNVMEEQLQVALDKCEAILAEFMEAGIIIGTFVDEEGRTRKWAQAWGNNFTVAKIVEVEAEELDIASDYCYCGSDEDDD